VIAESDGYRAEVSERIFIPSQHGHMAGADNNVERITGRRSMTVGEFARLHADQINGN
jgi:hypothetical protein